MPHKHTVPLAVPLLLHHLCKKQPSAHNPTSRKHVPLLLQFPLLVLLCPLQRPVKLQEGLQLCAPCYVRGADEAPQPLLQLCPTAFCCIPTIPKREGVLWWGRHALCGHERRKRCLELRG